MDAIAKILSQGKDVDIINKFRNYENFEEWKQDVSEHNLQKQLKIDRDSCAKSPEELLIEREDNEQRFNLVFNIVQALGITRFKILVECYVYNHTFDKLAEKYGYTIDVLKRNIRNSLNIVNRTINQMEDDNRIDDDLFFPKPPSSLPHAVLRPSFIFENAMEWPTETYKYNGEFHIHTKCMIPQYFKETFGDNNTICSLCMNDLGVNRCRCKKEFDA